jgi:primosomal protein N' (replication factor Y)
VARIAVDVSLAHLDRPFDYLVPADADLDAVPGCRVRVRFAGRLVDGYLLDRVAESAHPGRLGWLERVVSAEPVLSPEIAVLTRDVADNYAGTMADVLRLAVPPRHAATEARPSPPGSEPPSRPAAGGWPEYRFGEPFLDAVSAARPARAVWQALPGADWPALLAVAAATAAAADRGALLVVADQRDADRVREACAALLGEDAVVALSAQLGPAERYRRWLAVRRGSVRVVVGTRAAMFAPVRRLGLVAVWDDGDDLHAEPRAPYPQVLPVLVHRSAADGAALLAGGFARTAEAQLLVESGWARELVAGRDAVRAAAPRIGAAGADDRELARDPAARSARLPSVAFEAARAALAAGAPVLVQVPRRGYLPGLVCGACRHPARCRRCAGPLGLPGAGPARDGGAGSLRDGGAGSLRDGGAGSLRDGGAGPPVCRWCGSPEAAHRCEACGSPRLRASAVGAARTAEELGRALPGVPVRSSGGQAPVLATVPEGAALVIATPGAEPVAPGGYGAALLLDGWMLLTRPGLRAGEEALRRWLAAAALVRPAARGGRVVVMAEPAVPTVQALVRWDPAGHAARELAARAEFGFPPATRLAAVDGRPDAVHELLDLVELPPGAEVLGPVPLPASASLPAGARRAGATGEEVERALLRVPRTAGRRLASALAAARAVRSTRKDAEPVRIQLDPADLGGD